MPARRPLVMIAGQTQNLPAGDTLDAPVSEVDVVQLNNASGSSVAICRVVCPSTTGFLLAQANASATKNAIGLVRDNAIANNASGNIQTDGAFTATSAQWDAVTGQTGGLTPNATYYLSPTTAGGLTSTPPSTTGQYVVPIGLAITTTMLDIRDSGFDVLL